MCESPPARVAWIETIHLRRPHGRGFGVATREGGVDRNFGLVAAQIIKGAVATREGGVDRNTSAMRP